MGSRNSPVGKVDLGDLAASAYMDSDVGPGCFLCVLRLFGNNYLIFCHVRVLLYMG